MRQGFPWYPGHGHGCHCAPQPAWSSLVPTGGEISLRSHTGCEQPCVSYVGQAELGAKTAVLSRATRQVRETWQRWGGRGGDGLGWQRALFAHPRKEEINIDAGLLRHSLGKPALSLRFSPGPISPSLACPLRACCQACPPPSWTPQLETLGQPFLLALWGGAETEVQREQGACFKSHSK